MGFGGEDDGGANLINNKFPSAPQSLALCLIAPYWFFLSLSFRSWVGHCSHFGTIRWPRWTSESNVIYSLPSSSSSSSSSFSFFTLSLSCSSSSHPPHDVLCVSCFLCLFNCQGYLKMTLNTFGCLWRILINTRDCVLSRKWSFYSQAYCILHTCEDGWNRKENEALAAAS